MKPTKEFIPMDDYERELSEYINDENYKPKKVENFEDMKEMLIQSAKNTFENPQINLKEISGDEEYNSFIKIAKDKGITYQEALKELIHQVVIGEINLKVTH